MAPWFWRASILVDPSQSHPRFEALNRQIFNADS
jgi:hypothetical protein